MTNWRVRLALCVLIFCSHASGQNVITTVAGSTWAFPLNVTTALSAPLGRPFSLAVDTHGNAYIADQDNNRIFEIVSDGTVRIVAGNGTYGFSGDGGPATSASLNHPAGLAVDASGNLFFVDSINYRVRKISAAGIITTVAGNGTQGFSGDDGLATSASLALDVDAVQGPGASAVQSYAGVAVDALGDLFIADTFNNRIRKVSPAGIISTFAGNGAASFSGDNGQAASASLWNPGRLAVDTQGNLFTDCRPGQIRKISTTGIITTVAGNGVFGFSGDGGPATSASFSVALGIAADAFGNFFFSDGQRIRMVSASGMITTVVGTGNSGFSGDGGLAASAMVASPTGVAVDATGNLFVADWGNDRVRKVAAGLITTVAGNGSYGSSGDNAPGTSVSFFPTRVAVDVLGNLFISDTNRVRKLSGGIITTVAGNGQAGFSGDKGPAASALLSAPAGLAVDGSGNLFIADSGNGRVRKVSPDGVITTVAGNGSSVFAGDGGMATSASLNGPTAVAADTLGNLYIAELYRVRKVSASGVITTYAGNGSPTIPSPGSAATSAAIGPTSLAVDLSGNLFIYDTAHPRVWKVPADGTIIAFAGNGNLGFSGDGGPATSASIWGNGIALDASGNIFLADNQNNRIRKVSGGIITTFAGNGSAGFSGDGGNAASASMNTPSDVTVDVSGNVFIADSGNYRIREVLAAQNLPVVNAAGVVNGASFSSQIAAAGEIVSVFGAGLGPSPGQLTTAPGGHLETSHAGVSVTFDGTPAALFYVSDSQLNIQVPWELGAKTLTTMLVTANGQAGPPRALQLQAVDPAIFIGSGRMAILNTAGAQITAANPASAGVALSIYATGLGAVSPAASSGQLTLVGTLYNTVSATTVMVGGITVPASFSGLAPGLVGAYQINFTVPSGLTSGDQPLVLSIAGSSTSPLPLAVR